MNHELLPFVGQHEIEAGSLELAVEDQVGVGNNERAIRHMAMSLCDEGLGRKGIGMDVARRTGNLAVQGRRGVEFASVVQPGHRKRVKI
ncbi:hypothetical protein GCM10007858_16430 [Bradyrhizobium liaoningense]|nr:hypothetical protein GCM10007858_16430 [Bradyrhizobium liaoningense]